jgi:hypothetical protein
MQTEFFRFVYIFVFPRIELTFMILHEFSQSFLQFHFNLSFKSCQSHFNLKILFRMASFYRRIALIPLSNIHILFSFPLLFHVQASDWSIP